jgi:hypothetical protein
MAEGGTEKTVIFKAIMDRTVRSDPIGTNRGRDGTTLFERPLRTGSGKLKKKNSFVGVSSD